MKTNIEKFYDTIENNKKKLDKLKEMSAEECIESEYFYTYYCFRKDLLPALFRRFNVDKIGDILLVDRELIKRYIMDCCSYMTESSAEEQYNYFVKYIHSSGLIFKDEFKNIGLSDDVASVRLQDIDSFPKSSLRKLARLGINNLGQLLSLNYKSLCRIRQLGESSIKELKCFIHSLGYSFEGEYQFLDEKIEDMRNSGVELLEKILGDSPLCNILYRNDIFIVDDLINNKTKILNIKGFGPKRFEELTELMKLNGLEFIDEELEINSENILKVDLCLLEGFPMDLLPKLRRYGIYNLEQLLSYDYSAICKIKQMGESGYIEFKKFVHSLGYKFEGEFEFLSEVLEDMRNNGIQILDDVFDDNSITGFLYRNGIFTVDDLVKSKNKIYEIKKFGPIRRKELFELMEKAGISFIDEEKNKEEKVLGIFNELDDLFEEKRLLLEEQRKLIKKEKELDRLIEAKIKEASATFTYKK